MIKAQCPYCGSFKVNNYGLHNTAIEKDELEISSVMVECGNCGKLYDVVVWIYYKKNFKGLIK